MLKETESFKLPFQKRYLFLAFTVTLVLMYPEYFKAAIFSNTAYALVGFSIFSVACYASAKVCRAFAGEESQSLINDVRPPNGNGLTPSTSRVAGLNTNPTFTPARRMTPTKKNMPKVEGVDSETKDKVVDSTANASTASLQSAAGLGSLQQPQPTSVLKK